METTPIVKNVSECVTTLPLDEAVWQAWVAKGRARDKALATRLKMLVYVTPLVIVLAWFWFFRF